VQPRHLLIPNANSPELLARLLEMVGRGIRTARALAEALSVETRTVGYYTQAAQWLNLLDVDEPCSLTPLGVEFVFANQADRPAIYARAVWANPVVAELLAASNDKLPSVGAITARIAQLEPEMAPSTVRRRATAIRGLLAPAIGVRRVAPPDESRQMGLPFGLPPTPPAPERLETVGQREYSPDAYRFLVASLLDHGELQLRHVRGLLDRAGADRAPIGGYIDMAIARGDAVRVGKALIASAACAARAELVESVSSIMLSDPHYRAYLEDGRLARTDRLAAARFADRARRFRGWDRRLFGRPADPETLEQDLGDVVLERSLSAFPLAVRAAEPPLVEPGPFLATWTEGIRVACPPTLVQLQGGVAAVNRLLRDLRQNPDRARVPNLVDPTVQVHRALLSPGEPVPRAVPDTRSLRIRVLMNAPYIALCGALLLVHRQQPHRLVVHRSGGRWRVKWDGDPRGQVLPFLDDLARSLGWVVCRRAQGGLPDSALFDGLEAVGIASVIGRQAVLSERFFGQLRDAPDELEVHALLGPLAEAVEGFLVAG
jgi:hypothetical protein